MAYPYRFREIVSSESLNDKAPIPYVSRGAKALYDLYTAGISFRLEENTPLDAIAIYINFLPEAKAAALDHIKSPYIYVAKAPDAILKTGNGRMVFYDALGEYEYGDFPILYARALARTLAEADIIGAIPGGIPDPQMLMPGMPYPDMDVPEIRTVFPEDARKPIRMPLSYSEAQTAFGIDRQIWMPSIEYSAPENIPENLKEYVHEKIIPAAFAWYHYFTHTPEDRWGIPKNGFTFKDCLSAIAFAMYKLGVSADDAGNILDGNLKDEYSKFTPPSLRTYSPAHLLDGVIKVDPVAQRKRKLWQNRTPEEKRAIYDRHNARLRGETPVPVPIGRRPRYPTATLEELEQLRKDGKISIAQYFVRKRKLKGKA